jgi:hypothetical protein
MNIASGDFFEVLLVFCAVFERELLSVIDSVRSDGSRTRGGGDCMDAAELSDACP